VELEGKVAQMKRNVPKQKLEETRVLLHLEELGNLAQYKQLGE